MQDTWRDCIEPQERHNAFNICDRACENRAYLHTNFASFFKLQTDVTLYLVILSQ